MSQHYVSIATIPDNPNDQHRMVLYCMVDSLIDRMDATGERLDVTDINLTSKWDEDYSVYRWILTGGGVPE